MHNMDMNFSMRPTVILEFVFKVRKQTNKSSRKLYFYSFEYSSDYETYCKDINKVYLLFGSSSSCRTNLKSVKFLCRWYFIFFTL